MITGQDNSDDVEAEAAPESTTAATLMTGADETWQRRERRVNALSFALATHGKHAKSDNVLETANKYLAFIEG